MTAREAFLAQKVEELRNELDREKVLRERAERACEERGKALAAALRHRDAAQAAIASEQRSASFSWLGRGKAKGN